MALVGLWGMLGHLVNQRRREIGVRMALGSSPGGIFKLMLLQGLRPTLVGAVVGTAGALALGRVLESLLFETSPTDTFTYAVVLGGLIAIAVLACTTPAVRAARMDPAAVLQSE